MYNGSAALLEKILKVDLGLVLKLVIQKCLYVTFNIMFNLRALIKKKIDIFFFYYLQ